MIIAILGLGYVGLPLAIELGKIYNTIGFDISEKKINNLNNFYDENDEIEKSDFQNSLKLRFTNDFNLIKNADFFIVAVPTPVGKNNRPDLRPLENACKIIGKSIKKKSIIIFEPTVFPGATEDICIPIIEKVSNLKWKTDFNVAYSPERINPGDKNKTLRSIVKVVSADNKKTLEKVSKLYSPIIDAGIVKAKSIKIAETAKVIENTQRDLNIALMNELAIICDKMNIETKEVLKVAATKWNFLNFNPGLVGGHCIGVDPYYLTYKSKLLGHKPTVILSGRHINDFMSKYIYEKIVFFKKTINKVKPKILVLGLTFKENCNDLRNSKVADVILQLKKNSFDVYTHDPLASKEIALNEYEIKLSSWKDIPKVDMIVLAVSHKNYKKLGLNKITQKLNNFGVFLDIKSNYSKEKLNKLGFKYWCL